MDRFQYIALASVFVSVSACLFHLIRLLRLGKPKEFSNPSGNVTKAEIHAYTMSMVPWHKESAYKHLPTFTAGIFFHVGTFISLLVLVLSFFFQPADCPQKLLLFICLGLALGAACGYTLLIKRLMVGKLRKLSHPDDFLSNALTTLFQILTVSYLLLPEWFTAAYYVSASIFVLYIPVGKLRHVVYFVAARFHLGFFYGWRNVWPPTGKKIK
jgi:nitrate reductase gamma subunit